MATAKQIAARKLFAQRAKSGEFKRNPTKRAKARASAQKIAVNAPSRTTGKKPSARLKERRAANTRKGYYPNPVEKIGTRKAPFAHDPSPFHTAHYSVIDMETSHIVADFPKQKSAVEYAQALANRDGKSYGVKKFK